MAAFRSLERKLNLRSVEELKAMLAAVEAIYGELRVLEAERFDQLLDEVEELSRSLTLELARRRSPIT